MKKIFSILLTLSMVLSLCACNNNNNNKDTTPSGNTPSEDIASIKTPEDVVISTDELLSYYDFNIADYVTLGDYKTVEVNLSDSYEITDEAVRDYVNMYLAYYGGVQATTRTVVQDKDTVVIDFAGTMNGVAFIGGTSTDYKVEIGSNALIPGFESGIIGHSIGEEFVLKLKFPDPYENNLEYSGKDVEFTVTVNEIYEPVTYTYDTITDEYVKTTFNADSVEDYIAKIREQMESSATSQMHSDAEQEYLHQLLEICKVTLPDKYMDDYKNQVMEQVRIYAEETLNMDLESYIREYERLDTIEEFEAQLNEQLEEETKQQFVLDAIIQKEGRTITQVGYDDFVDYYLGLYGLTEDDFYKQYGEKGSIMLIYAENQLLADLMENVKINVGVQPSTTNTNVEYATN